MGFKDGVLPKLPAAVVIKVGELQGRAIRLDSVLYHCIKMLRALSKMALSPVCSHATSFKTVYASVFFRHTTKSEV